LIISKPRRKRAERDYYAQGLPAARHGGAWHPESPARLPAIRDQLIASRLYGHLLHADVPLATDDPLARVHSRRYIAAIKAAAPSSGTIPLEIPLDSDTPMNPHTPGYSLPALGEHHGARQADVKVLAGL
jgi:acetoin utilization deacetylase AcuC-like enzyme